MPARLSDQRPYEDGWGHRLRSEENSEAGWDRLTTMTHCRSSRLVVFSEFCALMWFLNQFHPHDLITSQGCTSKYYCIAGLGFQHMNGGNTNTQSLADPRLWRRGPGATRAWERNPVWASEPDSPAHLETAGLWG